MHQGQKAVYESTARIKVLVTGRRWRKTTLCMRMALRVAASGQPVLWGAPTFRQDRIGWQEMYRAAAGVAHFHKQNMEITVPPGNGIVSFVSLDDPNNARGKTAKLVIVDEAGHTNSIAWEQVLRPMISDNQGYAVLAGTPNGRNWFWEQYQIAKNHPEYGCWQAPTLGVAIEDGKLVRRPNLLENPDFPFREAQILYDTLPEMTFRQEFLAQFLENEGTVFRRVGENCCGHEGVPEEHVGHIIICGVDWGRQEDYTAISVICRDCMKEVYKDKFNQIDYHFQRQRLKNIMQTWSVQLAYLETNSVGQVNLEEMIYQERMPVAGFETTQARKAQLMEGMALAFDKRSVDWIEDPVWQAELEAYERSISGATGRASYSAPKGVHDDTVMARALALWGVTDSGPQVIEL